MQVQNICLRVLAPKVQYVVESCGSTKIYYLCATTILSNISTKQMMLFTAVVLFTCYQNIRKLSDRI